jgi:alpha-glucosidase
MYERWIQTLDPDRFALDKVQYVVNTLKESGRDFIVMVDPAVFSGTPNSSVESYETYQTGVQQDIFMKLDGGDIYEGVVWPGPTAFPDWTHPNAQQWWTQEFERFFNNETGFDVSGIWLDMNEPANFLPYVSQAFYIPTDILARSKHLPSVPRTTSPSSSRTTPNRTKGTKRFPSFPIWTQYLGCLE